MIQFDIQEYVRKALVIPVSVFIILLFVLCFASVILIKQIKRMRVNSTGVLGRLIRVLPLAIVLSACIASLLFFWQPLRYGLRLVGENSDDAISVVGEVVRIEETFIYPEYQDKNGMPLHPSIVHIGTDTLYFMSSDNIQTGDVLRVTYLPHSTMVLTCEKVSHNSHMKDYSKPVISVKYIPLVFILALVYVFVVGIYSIRKGSQYLHLNNQTAKTQKIEDNQIRLHHSYLYVIVLLCAVNIVFALVIPAFTTFSSVSSFLIIIYGILSYRNDRVEYDETGITLFSILGRPYYIQWKQIKKVEVAEELLISRRLSKGYVLRIFCDEHGNKNAKKQTVYRYPYTYYVGIEKFRLFYSKYGTGGMLDSTD